MLKNGKELTKENLLELIEQEEFFLGSAMKRNIEKGKLDFVAKKFDLLQAEKMPGQDEFFELRDRLHQLRDRLSFLTSDVDLGGNDAFSNMAIASAMTESERKQLLQQLEENKKEAASVRAEIAATEEAVKKNEYYRFANNAGTLPVWKI